jgi:esterase/lipase superfamily enzyme
MNREYHKWFSPHLSRDMELLVFGHAGTPVLFFPTRTARFYDYEDWKVIEALEPKIRSGAIQVYCLDSIDMESFYCKTIHPADRIARHMQYEQYVLNEVLDLVRRRNPEPSIIAAGCSLGAYHAVNIAFRNPGLFRKVVGLSGRYDLTMEMAFFDDLFEGYKDENIYYNMPSLFIPNLEDEYLIGLLRTMEIVLVVGQHDAFLDNNLHLSDALWKKGVWNGLHIWDGESHKARYWRYMVQLYL